jgi:threonine/homoserine/homoserine lactone efflux protein
MAPDLWIYFLAVLAVILLPGMDMAFVMASSLAGGRHGATSAVLGIASGGAIHMVRRRHGHGGADGRFPQLFRAMLRWARCICCG